MGKIKTYYLHCHRFSNFFPIGFPHFGLLWESFCFFTSSPQNISHKLTVFCNPMGNCSLLYTQIISRKVGHSSVQTTDRVYSHLFEDEFKNVPNVLEEFLTVKAN